MLVSTHSNNMRLYALDVVARAVNRKCAGKAPLCVVGSLNLKNIKMIESHLHVVSPLILAHLRRAALDKGIARGSAAAVVSRLEEMATGLLPDSGKIFSSLFAAGDMAGVSLPLREIGQLFWRERLASIESRRHEGSFYTPESVVDGVLDLVMPALAGAGRRSGECPTFCDPAVGCGFFPLRLVERLRVQRIRAERLREWAGQALFGVDTDAAAVFMARALLWLALSDAREEFRPSTERFHIGDSLLGPAFGETAVDGCAGFDWGAAFPVIAKRGGFDVVAGNPPYEVLTNFRRHPGRKALASALRTSGFYQEALCGQINMYRCFIERGLALVKPGGLLSYVVPLSLARDGAAEGLRRRLLLREDAGEWRLYGENERLFTGVTQSACVFSTRRGGGRAGRLSVTVAGVQGSVGMRELEKCGDGLRIPGLDREGLKLWRWFYRHCPGRLDEMAEARVGEVDQTVYRACMMEHDTGCLLARGGHLRAFLLDVEARPEKERFLDQARFLAMKGQGAAACRERAEQWRIVQLGIRNMHSAPRLLAALAPPGVYLGNSLNVYFPREGAPIAYLAGVLNSAWLDWLFRVGSGNNNINLREMRGLPFPSRVSAELMREVESAFRVCEKTAASGGDLTSPRAHLDRVVARCYGLPAACTPEMLRIVL